MSSLQPIPKTALLLRYLDGELPARKSRQVRGHLEACWQCRTAVEDLRRLDRGVRPVPQERAAGASAAARRRPWADLSDGFARIDAEVGAESWMARLGRLLAAPPARRWALSAMTALLLAAGSLLPVPRDAVGRGGGAVEAGRGGGGRRIRTPARPFRHAHQRPKDRAAASRRCCGRRTTIPTIR